jgi:hypothetical protein
MKKLERKNREDLLAEGEIGSDLRNGVAGRDKSVCKKNPIYPLSLSHYNKIEGHVSRNQKNIGDWIILWLDCIPNRDHSLILFSAGKR